MALFVAIGPNGYLKIRFGYVPGECVRNISMTVCSASQAIFGITPHFLENREVKLLMTDYLVES